MTPRVLYNKEGSISASASSTGIVAIVWMLLLSSILIVTVIVVVSVLSRVLRSTYVVVLVRLSSYSLSDLGATSLVASVVTYILNFGGICIEKSLPLLSKRLVCSILYSVLNGFLYLLGACLVLLEHAHKLLHHIEAVSVLD